MRSVCLPTWECLFAYFDSILAIFVFMNRFRCSLADFGKPICYDLTWSCIGDVQKSIGYPRGLKNCLTCTDAYQFNRILAIFLFS